MRRAELITSIAATIGAIRRPHPLRVAITGISAAGKSTLADELSVALAPCGRPTYRCEFDDFHTPGYKWRSVREEWTPQLYWDEGYDYQAFRRFVLEPLAPGGERRCRFALFSSYHDAFLPEVWIDVAENGIVIADGGLLLHPSLAGAWDFVIWLEIDEETVLARAKIRDSAWASDVTAIERRYRTYHLPVHRMYVASGARERPDVFVHNREPANPMVEWQRSPPGQSVTL